MTLRIAARRRLARLSPLLALLACATQNHSDAPPNGTLLASEPIRITTAYDEQSELTRFRFPRDVYERAAHDDRFAATHKLPFTLVSDTDKAIAGLYGVTGPFAAPRAASHFGDSGKATSTKIPITAGTPAN